MENFPCALTAKSQITPLRRVMFAINTTTTSSWVCFNPKRTEKPCALGFSVRFGLKHTLHCVIRVKSWKLEALNWAGSGVFFYKKYLIAFIFSKWQSWISNSEKYLTADTGNPTQKHNRKCIIPNFEKYSTAEAGNPTQNSNRKYRITNIEKNLTAETGNPTQKY